MKKVMIFCLLLGSTAVYGQKNNLKLTLAPVKLITANNIGIGYERKISDRFSAGLRFNFSSRNAAPLSDELTEFAQDRLDSANANADIFNNKFTSTGLTLEFRYYPGSKALKGFYLAPYFGIQSGTLANFDFDFPDKSNPLVTNGGNVEMGFNFFGAGIGLGNQWLIADRISIDVLWVGLGVGANNFNLTGTERPGEQVDFDEVKKDVDGFIADQTDDIVRYFTRDIESEVTDESITVTSRNLVPYTKFLNFSIGFAF